MFTKEGDQFVRWELDTEELLADKYLQREKDGVMSFSKLYTGQDRVFSSYLNSDGHIEIKFGNGVVGRKLSTGDRLYVFYLESNGLDGYVNLNQVDDDQIILSRTPQQFGMTQSDYDILFATQTPEMEIQTIDQDSYQVSIDRDSLTTPRKEEDVREIRENAPDWFKTGNRLITRKDY